MTIEHFLAILPLMVLFTLSLILYRKGVLHLMTLSYSVILAFIATIETWEMLFIPVCAGSVFVSLLLFIYCMLKGEWL